MFRRRHVALAVIAVLCSAGCGVRVDHALRTEAADAQLGTRQAGAAARTKGAAQGPATATDATPAAAGDGASGAATGGPAAAGQASAGATSGAGASPAAAAPTGGNGGATDVGVTADTIVLGNVSDLSGPVPGIFRGAAVGTLAYLNYVNSQGGVYGRQLKLNSADSQFACSQTQSAYNGLTSKVFAFVGSFNIYDDCSAEVLGQHPDIPSVEYKLSGKGITLPNNFSVDPILPGQYVTGPFTYYASKFGDAVKHVGSLWGNIPSAIEQVRGVNAAAESVGWKFVYTRAIAATETNYTADIVRMQSAGVKVVFLIGLSGPQAATVVQEAQQQNWHPIFVLPISYAQNFVQLVGGAKAAEGIYGFNLYSLYFNADDARDIPELATYQQWMRKTSASQPMDLYSMYGWAEASLFVQALKAAGPRATRASLMAALRNVHQFSANGMVGPADPAGKVMTKCYVLYQVRNGVFVRLDTPPGQYRCDGAINKG